MRRPGVVAFWDREQGRSTAYLASPAHRPAASPTDEDEAGPGGGGVGLRGRWAEPDAGAVLVAAVLGLVGPVLGPATLLVEVVALGQAQRSRRIAMGIPEPV